MPSFPPRTKPIKKREQLAQKQIELEIAIRKNFPAEKINRAAEKYRAAQLSLFKAIIHEIKEWEFQKKQHSLKVKEIEADILLWTNKTTEDIIKEV